MRSWRPWTAEDVARLKSMARKYTTKQIASELNRGHSATVMKAQSLGLSLRLDRQRHQGTAQTSADSAAAGMDVI
jgi:hypothetical protein